ncbi:MAG: PAS-domain containing protein [Gammaproteobacteria bacterium]|nr:PAS-domain containing protein [Gammaproteobacteria bacterium]
MMTDAADKLAAQASVERVDGVTEVKAAKSAPHSIFGIKTKLFVAFCGMAGLTALAGTIAWYAFGSIGRSVDRINKKSVPAMVTSLHLAEKSAEIAAIAPSLMASTNQHERTSVRQSLEERVRTLVTLTQSLEAAGIAPDRTSKLTDVREKMTAKLNELDTAVQQRLQLKVQREETVTEIAAAHDEFISALEPVVDDAVFDLIISGEEATATSTEAITDLVEGGVSTIHPLLTVNAEINLAAGLLAEAANVTDPSLIQPIHERFVTAAATVERSLDQLTDLPEQQELQHAMDALLALGAGDDSMFELRERELRASASTWESLNVKRETMAETAKDAHQTLLAMLTPMVDDAMFDLVISAEDLTAQSNEAINDLIDGGVNTLHILLALRAEANLAAGLVAEAANVPDASLIQPIRERFVAAASHIDEQLEQLPSEVSSDAIRNGAGALVAFGSGDDGLFSFREQELRQIATAESLLQDARSLAVLLGDEVAGLVSTAQTSSDDAALRATKAINEGNILLVAITAVSLAGAVLIVVLYVAPRVVRPLENITTAMTELAAGDTTVDIPARERRDEIGRMAQALGVFRDTAIEVQQSNLMEIREGRRRLTDAIESISEAFSLYDNEDRLIVCNEKYRTLLYPGIADEIAPGMTFESIIRRAAERGYVKDAQDRVEEWLEQRLAQHREPGEPHVQQRGDGRWILVSERKTEDGGTVAVYSDITEMKQHEEELAEKSNALELLSNQLAKYLSPQVYESIFSGKQEVKVASRRKKLTVFFSDIAGFTETADRLESEDLSQLLNHYLTEMSQIALAHGATIDKYVGDAIVIFFGDPETRGVKQDALACVKMAIAMRQRLQELQGVWRASGIEKPLRCRIGINTGYCTVGNFGSEDRMDYTIIGGGVNLASRLESAATPGEILISYETFAHVQNEIHCEERGQIEVKGIAYPVATYQVVDSYDNLGQDRQRICEELNNLKLDLDLDAMSSDEKSQAAIVLRRALDRLTTSVGGGSSER